jgi:hypothetical protein
VSLQPSARKEPLYKRLRVAYHNIILTSLSSFRSILYELYRSENVKYIKKEKEEEEQNEEGEINIVYKQKYGE